MLPRARIVERQHRRVPYTVERKQPLLDLGK